MSTTSRKTPIFWIGLLGGGYAALAVLVFLTTPRFSTASVSKSSPPSGSIEIQDSLPPKRTSIFFTPLKEENREAAKPAHVMQEGTIRRTYIEPGSDCIEDIFYSNEQIIARQKSFGGKVIEQTGTLPEGKVKFFDAADNSYGEEYYKNGKKTHVSRTYYEDGRLKSEANYRDGRLMSVTDYYHDGDVRFQGDYRDARDAQGNDPEVGIGKLYYPDGTLKFEWKITKGGKNGFKKSYNRNGELVFEIDFDENGDIIQ